MPMDGYRTDRRCCSVARLLAGLLALLVPVADARSAEPFRVEASLKPEATWSRSLADLKPGRRGELVVSIAAPADDDRIAVELSGPEATFRKELHAGDPDLYLPYRPARDGEGTIRIVRIGPGAESLPVQVSWAESDADDALEAEPNDDWQAANPLILGRAVHGSADDVDWLENPEEGRAGLDWFRFEVDSDRPILATFTLDLIDREVSADLAVFRIEDERPVALSAGVDPMEVVHDRERVRSSKNLVRTLAKGTYYLRVNANHPAYVLRSRTSGVPPFDDPSQAVEAGLHYILNAGDAWLGQVPREGNRFVRSANLHETGLRCTGCHATSFPAEAALAARRAGYAIEAKDALANMIDRIADGPAPLYGNAGLNWQRYIATPLEAQGAQGGVLLDFDREIADVPTQALERFGPFLKAAWESRTTLPEDEHNVVPAESKFGLAWKGWRMLSELARRNGRKDDAQAAANVATVATGRTADRQAETLQDRIHRLVAWSLIDREANANKIRRESGSLLALQNPDGGWHESDARAGPSAVYTTGQMVDALLETGLPREHPGIDRALKFLLTSQQGFGGWFQPDTHENFRTPMRETRWAVTALARAFPRDDRRGRGWGGRAVAVRADSLAHTIEDLEAAWDPPQADAAVFVKAVAALLDHQSPLVRSSAASCLGRLGGPEAVVPLLKALNDRSKLVRRAAGAALRSLGNRGIGADATLDVLTHASPRARREAVALLTRQAHGFEGHPMIVDRLARRAGDPDLLTRFEAARALRRWFYRTPDTIERKRIVEALLAQMAVERVPLLRRNLGENLYILMDENLGGGVSLQRNLAALPEALRGPAIEARQEVERVAILGPILTALRDGDDLQRAGVLRAFDGSFLRGRTYARRPDGAVDVGNDREFGFLHDPPLAETEPAFLALMAADLAGPERRMAIQLADFFQVAGRTRSRDLQAAFLAALDDRDDETRAEAVRVVGREMRFEGAEDDPGLSAAIAARISGPAGGRAALVAAVGRNPALSARPEITTVTLALANALDAASERLPLLDRLGFCDDQIVAAIGQGWEVYGPGDRSQALNVLLRLPPSEAAVALLTRASDDPSEAIRERAVAARIDHSSTAAEASAAILPALSDPAPKIRRLALAAAAQRASSWDRADALEALARTLLDPDAEVRSGSLDVVKHHRLLARFPILARRVKALMDDPALAPRAEAILRAAGRAPAEIAPDVAIDRPLLLDAETFRRDVNPLFNRPGPDGHSCADCHATHAVLRLASPRDGGPDDEDVALNFASASRVVDLSRPESSLLLRKPLSPTDEGEPGPDGLAHAGGPRWGGEDDPAYRAVLAWIRASAAQVEPPPTLGADEDRPEVLDPIPR